MPRFARSICPPGVFCLSNTLLMLLMLGIIGLLAVAVFKPQMPTIILPSETKSGPTTVVSMKGGDSRYDRAPQPLRDWISMPELPPRGGLTSMPVNIPTRGLPESFQSIGVITANDKVLPLYGRRTTGGSDRWNYYTRTDTYNPVPLPISFKKRNCMDQVGCNEIDSGEKVRIDGMNVEGTTELYKMDGPKYIPGMI